MVTHYGLSGTGFLKFRKVLKFAITWHILPSVVVIPLQGLALINGTQMITSLGAEAVERAQAIARQADIIAALTLEVLKGTTKAFDSGEREWE